MTAAVRFNVRLRPSRRAVLALALTGGGSLGLGLFAQWLPLLDSFSSLRLPLLAALIVLVLLAADYHSTRRQPLVRLERVLPRSLALNQWVPVQIIVAHDFAQAKVARLFDGITHEVIAEGVHCRVHLQPQQPTILVYRLRALQRGSLRLATCHIEITGTLGLWLQRYTLPVTSTTKVYPDFAAVTRATLLTADNQARQLGIRTHSRRGEGSSFHQLREYRLGDSLRQLDWNTTAKRARLISKEYQEERDQNVVLMIDSGRRMRSQDDELNHFDHALNASIVLSYVALRQGDSVAVMSFGASDRWIPPQKGSTRVNVILNGLYDLQAGNNAPDYSAAAEKLLTRQAKRSLIILVTNSRDEELDELQMAINLLKKRHLVLVANIREAILDTTLHTPVATFDEAVTYAGTVDYVQQRSAVHKKLQGQGIFAVDTLARALPATLANNYWEIKRAGLL